MLDKTSASIAETSQQRNKKSAVHASFVSECIAERQEDVFSLVDATKQFSILDSHSAQSACEALTLLAAFRLRRVRESAF
jgi:hypothetical protein